MNVNKKLGRLKQWAGERMGGEVRTNVSENFKTLEMEMGLRYDGIKSNHQAMNDYVKSISQKIEGSNREKQLPMALLGSTMLAHGEDFEMDSEFGQCLSTMGRTEERLAKVHDHYVQKASSTWLDSLERSVAQHKELSKSRKKLDDRRLAFDTAAAKMEKTKRDDFRTEEELRSQRAKYDEASEDVYRRMLDVKDMETDSVQDLTDFLDAQLAYFEKCRGILLQAKREWPAVTDPNKRLTRSRSNTGSSYSRKFDTIEENGMSMGPPAQPARPGTGSSRISSASVPQSPARELPGFDLSTRPGINRASTFDGIRRDISPASSTHSGYRMPSESLSIRTQKSQLRSVSQTRVDDSISSPSSFSASPVDSTYGISIAKKKPPPPPPPSRATKPPPPLPPVRRGLQEV